MATFKAGQRVRIVRSFGHHPKAVGCEAIIIGPRESCDGYYVDILNYPPPSGCYWAKSESLEPLTDPGFDAFMEKVMNPINDPVTA